MIKHLQSVGMACFVNCFEDFEREAKGRCGREATKRAMFERGGATTDISATTKAACGVWLIKHGHAEAALAAICGSARVPPEVRDGARARLSSLQRKP